MEGEGVPTGLISVESTHGVQIPAGIAVRARNGRTAGLPTTSRLLLEMKTLETAIISLQGGNSNFLLLHFTFLYPLSGIP